MGEGPDLDGASQGAAGQDPPLIQGELGHSGGAGVPG